MAAGDAPAAAVSTHEAAGDPHPQYQLESGALKALKYEASTVLDTVSYSPPGGTFTNLINANITFTSQTTDFRYFVLDSVTADTITVKVYKSAITENVQQDDPIVSLVPNDTQTNFVINIVGT